MTVKKRRLWTTVTEPYAKAVENLVKTGVYISQGEALREALRLLFEKRGVILTPEEAES